LSLGKELFGFCFTNSIVEIGTILLKLEVMLVVAD